MDIPYERFVTIKELMHCYFPPFEKHVRYMTGSALALESHMNAFFGSATNNPPQESAEKMALWMALGVICSEDTRQQFIQKVDGKAVDAQQIAEEMVIPVRQAKSLLSQHYTNEIQKLIA